jgi:hypothetical protein
MIHKKETLKASCDDLLIALLGKSELCEMWWKTQNRAFDHKTPQELWDANGASDVYNYLMHHAFAGGGS